MLHELRTVRSVYKAHTIFKRSGYVQSIVCSSITIVIYILI